MFLLLTNVGIKIIFFFVSFSGTCVSREITGKQISIGSIIKGVKNFCTLDRELVTKTNCNLLLISIKIEYFP